MVRLGVFVGVALLLTATSFGQSTTGSISGNVQDIAGAPIAGASVVITNAASNVSTTITTNSNGIFIGPQLPPGTYSLSVEKQGHVRLVKNGVVLTTANQTNAGRFVLEAGAATEVVTQTADAGQLEVQSASGERSGLLTSVEIKDLALNGRNMLEMLAILPGIVSFVDGQVSSTAGLGAIHINDTRGNQHDLTIDGSSNVLAFGHGAVHVTINPDAVAEVKVLAANHQAEYGRSAGGLIQFVTRSGTRDLHGTARFFHRHEGLNANNYFRNAEGRNPDGSEVQPRPLYRYNYVGYDIGGPVTIGRWNQARDKLFFYWNQEFYRQLVPSSARNIRVPTAGERRGDFSQTVDAIGNKIFIRDPNRAGVCNAGDQTACFPGNIIPPNRFFQDGPAILNLYPAENFSGGNRFNYTSSLSSTLPRREEIVRVDYNLNARTRLSARYINNSESQVSPYAVSNFPLSPIASRISGRNGAISLSHFFSPVLTNEFIFGPGSRRDIRAPADDRATRDTSNIRFPLLFPNVKEGDYIPNFTYGGLPDVAFPTANFNAFPVRNINHTFNFIDNVSAVSGSHLIKTGIFIQRGRADRGAGTPSGASINFGTFPSILSTGYTFANALLGHYNFYQQANDSPRAFYRYTNLEGYVQDNWRVTRRFTLDYGLRLSWYQPQYEKRLQTNVFNPDLYDPAKAVRLYEPVRVGAEERAVDPANRPAIPTLANTLPSSFITLIVPDSGDLANGIGRASQGYPRGGFNGRGVQWGPRFGFAYDVLGNSRTLVRGGFGIFYDRISNDIPFQTLPNPPAVVSPLFSFGRLQDLGSGMLAPLDVSGVAMEGHIPTVYSYSLGVQREVGFDTVVDVAYVATLSRHLVQGRNLNAIPYGTVFTREAQDPTRYPNGVVPDVDPNLPDVYRQAGLRFGGINAKRVEFLRPFRGYGNISYREFVGSANYHSLQVAINRRFSRGLQFGLSYTWSKALGTASNDTEITHPFDTRRYDYRLLSFDRRHVFGGGFVYNIPSVSRYLGSHRLPRFLFDNWQISGIATQVSGAPLELFVSATGFSSALRIAGSYTEAPRFYLKRAPQPGPNGLQIDPGAFVLPPIGDTGPWPRQYLRGPGMNKQDISVFKNFPFGGEDSRYLQLRVEMFNAFNHTQFSSINTATNLAVPDGGGGFTTGAAILNNYGNAVITGSVRPAGSTEPLGRFFGEFNAAGSPRIIQLGVKLYF